MKKLLIFAVLMLIVGYVVYQDGSLWLLKILSLTSDATSNTPTASGSSSPNPPYKDGTYNGNSADAFYGNIQVQALITGEIGRAHV